jgi:hypothetical protein
MQAKQNPTIIDASQLKVLRTLCGIVLDNNAGSHLK